MKINQLTKIGILILGISFFFFTACDTENEVVEENLITEKQDYSVDKVRFSEFENNTKLVETLSELNASFKNKNNGLANRSNSSEQTYELNTDEAIYIENNDGTNHSYTFSIETEEGNYNLENIVLSSQENGTYKAYITTYTLTEQERTDLNNGVDVDLTDKSSIQEIDYNQVNLSSRSGCSFELITIEVTYQCTIDGCWDPAWTTTEYIHVWAEVCSGGGGGGSGDGSGSGSGTGGGGGGGTSGGSGNDNNIPTIPMNPDGTSVAPSFLITALSGNNTLTTGQTRWINNHNNADEVNLLLNFISQNAMSNEATSFAIQLIDILNSETTTDFDALNFITEAFNQNKIYNDFDNAFLNSVNQYMDINATASNPGLIQLQIYFSTKCAVLRYNNPTWSDAKIYWEASKDIVHITLDIFGTIPVVGEIADLTNGVLYLIEGDGVNATLSFAATIPIAGWAATGAKYAIKVVDATTIATKVKLSWKVLSDGTIYFGSSGSKLRKVLGITDSALQAHHLIPWEQRIHPAVQKAAKSGNAFHINEALNGIPRPSSLHLTGHSAYNTKTQQILNSLDPNASIDEAYDFVSGFANHIRDLITNNPTLNSGQIADLISYP